jgi:pimeloyl-ACP methyl ester carboxylesterase
MTLTEIYFESAGTKLFAVESGDGPPVVLLHGGLANHLGCRVWAGSLATRSRLITPDLRGSGRSIYHDAPSWDLLADDVAALLRHLGIARAVIGGISGGAAAATRVALRHPAITEALVVLHPAFGGAELGLTPSQVAAMQAMDAAGQRCVGEGIEVLFPLLDALPEAVRERGRKVFATYDPRSVAATTRFYASGAQPFASGGELAAITAPVLLVPGIDDTHPREVAEVYLQNLRDCTFREVDPMTLGSAIADWLTSRRAP